MERLKWAWNVLTSKAYIVATDTSAVVHVPYVDPYSIGNITMLNGQRIAIDNIISTLKEVVREHELRTEQLQREFKEENNE